MSRTYYAMMGSRACNAVQLLKVTVPGILLLAIEFSLELSHALDLDKKDSDQSQKYFCTVLQHTTKYY